MTKLLRRFMLCRQGVTAIEYALMASLIAIAIVTERRHGRNPAELELHPYRQRVSVTAPAFLRALSPPAANRQQRDCRRLSPS